MKFRLNIKGLLQTMLLSAILLHLNGCIVNDIPYPQIQVDFLTFEVEGQTKAAEIDTKSRTITLNLGEDVDISKVVVKAYSLTEGGEVVSPDLSETLNLNNEVKVTLKLYQEYEWTIKAEQPIDRFFTVTGQIGASIINAETKKVVVEVPKSINLKEITVNTMKLGPSIAITTPYLVGQVVDFSSPVNVTVKYFDITEIWTIYVSQSDVNVATSKVDAWTNVIWAYGTGQEGKPNGFQYKKLTATEWIDVPAEWITTKGGSFYARIIHLDPSTSYTVRAISDGIYGNEVTVATGRYLEIPNAMLNEWWKNGKVWNPWAEGGTPFWDTGNKGASTLGESNSIPSTETWNGAPGYSAMLQTKFVGIGMIGKLAAGNLFTGEFIRVDGTNGILNFGRPFAGRPTRLKGYYKYSSSPINYTSSDLTHMKGQPDTASIYMALTDWDAPYEIRTNPKDQQLFDKNSDAVIAYGELNQGKNVVSFTEFTIDLEYRSTSRVPKYVVIVCSASKYGDFFTGGSSSVLFVNNLWLEWDYNPQ